MRNLFLILTVVLCTLVSCGNNNKEEKIYTIVGEVETNELDGKWVFITPSQNELKTNVLDSALIQNRQFTITGTAPVEPNVAVAIVTEEDRTPIQAHVGNYIVIESGNINISIDKEMIMRVSGSPTNDMLNRSEDITSKYYERIDSIRNLDISNAGKYKLMIQSQENRNKNLIAEITPFINDESSSIFMNYHHNLFSEEELINLRKLLTAESLEKRSKIIEREENKAVGSKVNDNKIPNLDGDTISIMSIIEQHDYTLIDFWASWCGPCVRSIPEVKDIYNRYKSDKFEIIAISLDREYSDWKNAVEKHNLNWINISDLQAWKAPCVQEYSVLYIPFKILVDREGTIINRNPTAAELEIYLGE